MNRDNDLEEGLLPKDDKASKDDKATVHDKATVYDVYKYVKVNKVRLEYLF
jgi:hypothetical protein